MRDRQHFLALIFTLDISPEEEGEICDNLQCFCKYKLVPFPRDVTSYAEHYCKEAVSQVLHRGIMCLSCLELGSLLLVVVRLQRLG